MSLGVFAHQLLQPSSGLLQLAVSSVAPHASALVGENALFLAALFALLLPFRLVGESRVPFPTAAGAALPRPESREPDLFSCSYLLTKQSLESLVPLLSLGRLELFDFRLHCCLAEEKDPIKALQRLAASADVLWNPLTMKTDARAVAWLKALLLMMLLLMFRPPPRGQLILRCCRSSRDFLC